MCELEVQEGEEEVEERCIKTSALREPCESDVANILIVAIKYAKAFKK